ncbi:MAG: hypothetical protein AAFN93_26665, partial [Bacteroidota bacterium]
CRCNHRVSLWASKSVIPFSNPVWQYSSTAMETLLLFVYFLVVFYVLYQMALDLERRQEDRVKIHLDYDFLASQTQDQLNFQKGAKHISAVVSKLSFGKLTRWLHLHIFHASALHIVKG